LFGADDETEVMICPQCQSTGRVPVDNYCQKCQGRRQISDASGGQMCMHCGGTGKEPATKICPDCNGTGEMNPVVPSA